MSPCVFSCILCGVPIRDYSATTSGAWLDLFRVVYRNPSGCFISGVGCRKGDGDDCYDAPSDPNLRWDDERNDVTLLEVYVMDQLEREGEHGVVLHESCWKLLETACPSILGEIPFKRLVDIFDSVSYPICSRTAYWGHNYGNILFDVEELGLYPWEDASLQDRFRYVAGEDETGEYENEEDANDDVEYIPGYVNEDPYNVPDISVLLSGRTDYPPEWSISKQSKTKDLFSKLPLEIWQKIALVLPTESALNLRLVSKVFFPLLYSQVFWESRFEASGDRGFVFERLKRQNSAHERTDWLSLYRLTSLARCSPGLKNRRRIWSLLQPLVDTIDLSHVEIPGTGSKGHDHKYTDWTKVEGALTTEFPITRGCRLLNTHIGRISKDLTRIAFSFSTVGDVSFISGIRLISYNGSDVCLGWISKTNEIILEITKLWGFVLAMGSMGLHALQVVQENWEISAWIGSPRSAPRTERLVGSRNIEHLQVGYDGFKVVSLGISPSVLPPEVITHPSVLPSEVTTQSLRETALWYPAIPPPKLCLNQSSYTAGSNLSAEFSPLFWTHFGGPKGCKLKYLTSVSYDFSFVSCFPGLIFHYGTGPEHETCRIGRTNPVLEDEREEHFLIDGPGGEVIESVEVILEDHNLFKFLRDGKLKAVKLTTNRNRSFLAGYGDTKAALPLTIPPGTTLTGFYASKDSMFELISIGAISEVINE